MATKEEARLWKIKHIIEDNNLKTWDDVKEWGGCDSEGNFIDQSIQMTEEDFEKIMALNSDNDITREKDMFNRIVRAEFDKKIVAEYNARSAIFLCAAGGRLVENAQIASYNLLINDEAGSGKDYVTGNVLSILPSDIYIKKTRISPAVFTYWHNAQYEPEWTWDGKVFYTEDISENVLNSEVFKVMCSSGSEATVVIKQRAIDIPINGKPVMIVTTANSVPNPELTRRFEIVNLDGGTNQTKEIMKRHAEYATQGISPCYEESISNALSKLRRVKVKIPYASSLATIFPSESIMMRTKFPRFIDFIKASCALHQLQRKRDKDGYYLAEEQDYEIACQVMNGMATNKYMISLTKNQKRILDHIISRSNQNPTYQVTAAQLRNEMRDFLSLKAFLVNLSHLTSYGLLKTKLEIDDNNREREHYCISNLYDDVNKGILFPSFAILQENEDQK